MVYVHLFFLVLGFILLVKGSDFFVKSSSRIAKNFGISEFVIGLTLVAVGTSVPELSASIIASLKGESGIIVGNIIGSNIANIGLILGFSTLFASITIKRTMLKRDAYMMIFVSILFYVLAFDKKLTKIEGLFFLLLFITYTIFLVTSKKTRNVYHFKGFLDYFLRFKYLKIIKDQTITHFTKGSKKSFKRKEPHNYFNKRFVMDFIFLILGCTGIILGARYLVNEAIWLADLLKVSTTLIGITLIAVGTSLPELAVSFRAAKMGYGDMIIGNIIGSNITNILLIFGVSSVINTIDIENSSLVFYIPSMLLISFLLVSFMRTRWKFTKREGIILLGVYILFIISLFLFGFT